MPGRPKMIPLHMPYVWPLCFGVRPGKIYSLAHTRRLTAVFIFNKQKETPFKWSVLIKFRVQKQSYRSGIHHANYQATTSVKEKMWE